MKREEAKSSCGETAIFRVMIDGIFLTGTGTGVGKSGAAAFLVTAARSAGFSPLYWKPAQCGPSEWEGIEEPGGDCATVRKLSGVKLPTYCSYNFQTPSSPDRASRVEGKELSFDSLLSDWDLLTEGVLPDGNSAPPFDYIVVEGAGGLLVPLTGERDFADLSLGTASRLIVVAEPGLGTINATRLTIEAACARGLQVEGFLFSPPSAGEDLAFVEDNWKVISELEKVPFLGVIPRLSPGTIPFVEKNHPLLLWMEEQK